MIAAVQDKDAPGHIFGTDYEAVDDTTVPITCVFATSRAHVVKAVDRLLVRGTSTSVNLGTGRGIPFATAYRLSKL